ncbi:hypothetical protein HNR73_005919 [Phytomonospora endophytica]|uniref:Uncharacterized protein n=1 Tax=Phytomonospora endophytica TaxID=714109 RepID=A0A841G024_9ACTN|nr:hypothetical protein [Phytomonospora endophytica]GIG68940.1 hypothetical protein Pen01_52350 [Phytomonospora endophytica]
MPAMPRNLTLDNLPSLKPHLAPFYDPATAWGGLSHHITPEGLHLYLCPQHLATYQ